MIFCFPLRPRILSLALLALSSEPLRCGVPTVHSSVVETLPGVVIVQGRTAQGFLYLSGGVSSNERKVLEESARAYNVRLTFAEKGGGYLSDAEILIAGAKGEEILALTANGPLFYIQLPPGSYAISARFKGETRKIKLIVPTREKRIRHTFVWDLGEQSEDLKRQ